MSSKETTTTVETAPLSAEGREWNSALTQLMLANLEDSGYSYNPKEVTEYADPGKATQLENRISGYDEQITALEAKKASAGAGLPGILGQGQQQSIDRQIAAVQMQRNQAQSEYDGLESYTYTDYQIEKMPDPRVQNAINQFGADSPEVKAIEDTIFQKKVFKSEQMAGIEKKTLENITKLVNGDLSYTEEQKTQVDTLYGGVKTAITTLKDDLFAEYGATDEKLREGLNAVAAEIDKTGFAVEDALRAAELQVDKSGANMFKVLEDVNKSTEAKFKFQQDLLFEDIDTEVNQQNAMLGLPPNSEAAAYQKAKMKQDVMTGLQLQLHEQELTGKMGIQGEMEGSKQKISLSRVALAASQGEKKEGIARSLVDVTAMTAQKREGTLSAAGEALLGLEQQKAGELKNLAYGNIPSMIAAGQGAQGFDMQMTGAQQGVNAAAMSPFAAQLNTEQQRTFAESTTTQHQSGSFMDAFTGLLGTAASAYGAVASGGASLAAGAAAGAASGAMGGGLDGYQIPDFTPNYFV